jgi:hypothetical protein
MPRTALIPGELEHPASDNQPFGAINLERSTSVFGVRDAVYIHICQLRTISNFSCKASLSNPKKRSGDPSTIRR